MAAMMSLYTGLCHRGTYQLILISEYTKKMTIYISLAVLLIGTYQPFRYAVLNVSTKFYQSNRFERVYLHLQHSSLGKSVTFAHPIIKKDTKMKIKSTYSNFCFSFVLSIHLQWNFIYTQLTRQLLCFAFTNFSRLTPVDIVAQTNYYCIPNNLRWDDYIQCLHIKESHIL